MVCHSITFILYATHTIYVGRKPRSGMLFRLVSLFAIPPAVSATSLVTSCSPQHAGMERTLSTLISNNQSSKTPSHLSVPNSPDGEHGVFSKSTVSPWHVF